jgi:hypothetical protein
MNESDAIICLRCGRPAQPGRHFCIACTAPLTAHAVCDPFDVIKTEGFVYREASQRPEKPIVVVGMVVLFGPTFLAALLGATILPFLVLFERPGADFMPKVGTILLALVICGGWAAISGTLLYRTITNYFYPDGVPWKRKDATVTDEPPPNESAGRKPTAPQPPPVDTGEKLRDYLRRLDDRERNDRE